MFVFKLIEPEHSVLALRNDMRYSTAKAKRLEEPEGEPGQPPPTESPFRSSI